MSFLLGIDYDEMRAVAREFDARAGEAQRIITQAGTSTATLLDGWDGAASDEFAAQSRSCRARMSRIPGMLQHIAGALRTTADIVQDAENRARWELQQRLRQGGV
jgi:WXG100 family type VII secretion target